ncbi:MAG: CDP-glucose 4,6-dehydratase [Bacteroidia bacterium]|jgi:CDP-glucose 4,6-dehydratase
MEKMVIGDFYKGKKVLITGDTGFKGSWLALWLHSMGAEVTGYALPPDGENSHFELLQLNQLIRHVDGNLLDSEKLEQVFSDAQPEIVFHMAAQALVRLSYDEPKMTFETNVTGSVNVMEAIRKTASVRSLIYVTSDKCYKNKEWIWGYRENDELGGHDPYSASKAAAEIVFSSYRDSFFSKNEKIGVASVRAGNVIGGGDWAVDRIIPDCIRSLKADKQIEIRNPKATRPWQYVLEPLYGYMILAKNLFEQPQSYSGSWNFGPGIDSIKTVKELTEKTIAYFGKGSVAVVDGDKNKHEAGLLHLNCDKSHHELGWHPVWDFDQTINHTVSWYKDYLSGKPTHEISLKQINQFMEDSTND